MPNYEYVSLVNDLSVWLSTYQTINNITYITKCPLNQDVRKLKDRHMVILFDCVKFHAYLNKEVLVDSSLKEQIVCFDKLKHE